MPPKSQSHIGYWDVDGHTNYSMPVFRKYKYNLEMYVAGDWVYYGTVESHPNDIRSIVQKCCAKTNRSIRHYRV